MLQQQQQELFHQIILRSREKTKMKNSHQCIYHLIFMGQECTVPYIIVKKKQ